MPRPIGSVLRDNPDITDPTEHHLWLVLGTFADPKTMRCYPSIDTLAKGIRRSRWAVQRAMRRLEKGGHVETIRGPRTNSYRIIVDAEHGGVGAPRARAPHGGVGAPQGERGRPIGGSVGAPRSDHEESGKRTTPPGRRDSSPGGTHAREPATASGASASRAHEGERPNTDAERRSMWQEAMARAKANAMPKPGAKRDGVLSPGDEDARRAELARQARALGVGDGQGDGAEGAGDGEGA